MKKVCNVLAVLLLLAAVGMGFTGCPNTASSSNENPFIGTWISTEKVSSGGTSAWVKVVFDDNTMTQYASVDKSNWDKQMESAYTWSGNTAQVPSVGASGTITNGKLTVKFGSNTFECTNPSLYLYIFTPLSCNILKKDEDKV